MQPCPFLRLLLIEDVDDIQAILRFSLEMMAGWQVIVAKSTQDWLTAAQDRAPDVILVDVYAKRSDILIHLKRSFFTQDIPVVCLVSRDRLSDQLQAKEDGAAAIIAKPFDPINLVKTIIGLVESR